MFFTKFYQLLWIHFKSIIFIILLRFLLISKSEYNTPYLSSLKYLFKKNISVKNNSILILEPCDSHYECTSGFAKYFIDLGYNVDAIIQKIGISSFCFFEPINKIRIFTYNEPKNLIEEAENFQLIFKKYNYILIETSHPCMSNIFKRLNLLNINKTFFVFHHIDFVYSLPFLNRLKKSQIWSLGNFSIGNQVNPHYFGNITIKKKNSITKFFITSTVNRTYNFLISAAEELKRENLNFHVIVVGKTETFCEKNISESLKDYFTFKYQITYYELYEEINKSDYIIINLDPDRTEDIDFSKIRVTGSAQLAYGFLKPVLINEKFGDFYNFNSKNSFIFEKSNFSNVMKKAIKVDYEKYKRMQENLLILSKEIYAKSLYNVKNCLKAL